MSVATTATSSAIEQSLDNVTIAKQVQDLCETGLPLISAVENVAASTGADFSTVFAAVCHTVREAKFGI